MTTAAITDHARSLVLQRDGACLCEVVARRHRRGRNPAPVRASERAPNTRQPVPTPRSALGQKSRPLYHELRNTAAPRSGSRDTHHVTRRGYSKVAR